MISWKPNSEFFGSANLMETKMNRKFNPHFPLLAATVSAQAAPSKITALMPRADDYTLMW